MAWGPSPGDLPAADLPPQIPAWMHDTGIDVPARLDALRDGTPSVTIGDVAGYAELNHRQGDNPSGIREDCGLVSCQDVLNQFGVPAHADSGQSLEQLAVSVEQGHGVIAEANAGVLWDDASYVESGQANHAVTVTGVARDPLTGDIQGFYINDSGTGQSGEFVSAQAMTTAWQEAGGQCVVSSGNQAKERGQ